MRKKIIRSSRMPSSNWWAKLRVTPSTPSSTWQPYVSNLNLHWTHFYNAAVSISRKLLHTADIRSKYISWPRSMGTSSNFIEYLSDSTKPPRRRGRRRIRWREIRRHPGLSSFCSTGSCAPLPIGSSIQPIKHSVMQPSINADQPTRFPYKFSTIHSKCNFKIY